MSGLFFKSWMIIRGNVITKNAGKMAKEIAGICMVATEVNPFKEQHPQTRNQ